jgi:hypothetical protein
MYPMRRLRTANSTARLLAPISALNACQLVKIFIKVRRAAATVRFTMSVYWSFLDALNSFKMVAPFVRQCLRTT